MSFSTVLDTTIGLIFVYLVLSVFCTSINEAIASFFRLRARVLFKEIERIIGDKTVSDKFWQSGLMCSFSRSENAAPSPDAKQAPSYVCAKSFAAALLDSLRNIDTSQQADAAAQPEETPPSGQRSQTELQKLADKIDKNSILRDVLREFTSDAQQTEAKLKEDLAEWFDQVMERASGVYKRNMQFMSFVVALILVVCVNADTVKITKALWEDESLRAQVLVASERVVQEGKENIPTDIEALKKELPALPLGWGGSNTGGDCLGIVFKVFGLLLTTLALTLGAPFWFDLLSRFVKIRGAGTAITSSNNTQGPGDGTRS